MIRYRSLVLIAALATCASVPVASAQVRLFGIDDATLVELDPANGAVLHTMPLLGGPANTVGGLAYDPSTDTLFVASSSFTNLWTLDYTTGALTLIGPFAPQGGVFMHGFEIDDTGQLYGYSGFAAFLGSRFFRIDRTTGQLTPIGNPTIGGGAGLGYVPGTGTMYLGDQESDQLWTIDRTTGATTLVGPYGAVGAAAGQVGTGMAYHPQFGMYALNNNGTDSLWSLDLATGAATLITILPTNNMLSLAFVGVGAPGTSYCFGDGSATACPCGNASAVGSNSGCLSSLGVGGKLVASGTASLANDTVALLGTNMPNSSALYFQGTSQQAGGLGVVFGDGLRCAGGTIIRLGTTSNSAGASQYPFGAAPPVHVKGSVNTPGTRTYQVWYRNAAPFCTASTFNLTNGREISWGP
jgi:hypothetical protein